jgi:hypothetical protein
MYIKRVRHGLTHSGIYDTYRGIIKRCYDSTHRDYPYYGGRGIKVCQRWLESITNFYADMGPKPFPKAQLDRINNNGDYEPGNCRWVTLAENNKNRRKFSEIGLIKVKKDSLCSDCLKKITSDPKPISRTQYNKI